MVDKILVVLPSLSSQCLNGLCASSTCPVQPCQGVSEEIRILEESILQLSPEKCSNCSNSVLEAAILIVQERFSCSSFMTGNRHQHVLLVLTFLRLATKNLSTAQSKEAFSSHFVASLIRLGEKYSELYFDSAFQSQKMFDKLLAEVLAIALKLINIPSCHAEIFAPPNLPDLLALCVQLLPSNKNILVHGSLQLLYSLSSDNGKGELACEEEVKCNVVEPIVSLLAAETTDSNLQIQILASGLMLNLTDCAVCKSAFSQQVILLDAISVLLGKLSSVSEVSWNCSWCLAKLCSASEVCQQLNKLGAVALMLNIISHKLEDGSHLPETSFQNPDTFKFSISIQSAFSIALSRLCVQDHDDRTFLEANGMYIIAKMIFSSVSSSNKSVCDEWLKRTAAGLMVLRQMYSKEKNRSSVKLFFPTSLFDRFLDLGHFNADQKQYISLASECSDKIAHERSVIFKNLEKINLFNKAEPKTIGKFVIVNALGNGSFGSVFKVTKQGSNSVYALKKISVLAQNQSASKKKALTSTINNEINILKEKLNHPNIVRYFKSFSENENLYVVMEYVDGVSLQQHLDYIKDTDSHPIPEKWIWNFAIQLVQGLRYLHFERNLIHRDLSPNNILVSFENQVKITDFGFTRQTDTNGVLTSVVGTALYWCPEIVQKQPYDGRADIWAYGCVLYQICTLKPPFESTNILSLSKKVVECHYEPLKSDVYSDLLIKIISSCITSPNERPNAVEVVRLMSEKLLEQIDSQALELKNVKRKMKDLRDRGSREDGSGSFSSSLSPGNLLRGKSGSSSSVDLPAASPLGNSLNSGGPWISSPGVCKRGIPSVASTPTLTVHSSRVRELSFTADPLVESLDFLRKLDTACRSSFQKEFDPETHLLKVMRDQVYQKRDTLWMKKEIQKFISRSDDQITMSVSFTALVEHCCKNIREHSGDTRSLDSLTYSEFMQILEKKLFQV